VDGRIWSPLVESNRFICLLQLLIDDFKIKGTSIDMDKYPFIVHDIEQGLGVLHFSEKNNG